MLQVDFTPFPELTTNRLLLRQMNTGDAEHLYHMRSNPEIMRYIPRPLAQSAADILLLIEQLNENTRSAEAITWGIALKDTPQVIIGTIGYVRIAKENYRAEVGYLLNTGYHGKGLMQEALEAVVDYGFNVMKLHSIEAIVDAENIPSAKLLEKSRFIREAYFREKQFYKGAFHDSLAYSLLHSDVQ